MAARSASLRCCVLCCTTSAIGPMAEAPAVTPVFSSSAVDAPGTADGPASCAARSEGAYQPRPGHEAAVQRLRARSMPPSASRGEWQAAQWPRPCTQIGAAVPLGAL